VSGERELIHVTLSVAKGPELKLLFGLLNFAMPSVKVTGFSRLPFTVHRSRF